MERQQITSLAILDLSAAIDTMDQNILLHILEQKFGFCDKALKLPETTIIQGKHKQ